MYAIMAFEEMLENEINPSKDDDDWIEFVYSRLTEETRNRIAINPFNLVRTDLITFKSMIVNMLIV
jgi:hypothetical protein